MGCKVFDGHGEWRTLAGSMFVWCKRRIQKRVVKMNNNGGKDFFCDVWGLGILVLNPKHHLLGCSFIGGGVRK